MRWLILPLLLLAVPAWADMYPDASNAKLPEARINLGVNGPEWFSVRDFGAKGDSQVRHNCTSTISPSRLVCATGTFTAADVGKHLMSHGTGAAGAPQQGTIAAVINGTTITPSYAVASVVSAKNVRYGSDDTVAVTAAVAAGTAAQGTVYFPTGSYWLVSQTTPILLKTATLLGDGNATSHNQFQTGPQIWISNTATPAFTLTEHVNWRGLSVFYPLQDGSSATPIAYPETFGSDTVTNRPMVNVYFSDFNFINPYVLLKVNSVSGSAIGRVYWQNGRGYCVFICMHLLQGGSDNVVVGRETLWSIGAFSEAGATGLGTWTFNNGTFLLVDLGAATNPAIDGFIIRAHIIHGYRYTIRVLGGMCTCDIFSDVIENQSLLSIEGSGGAIGTISVPIWVRNTTDAELDTGPPLPVISCASSALTTQLNVVGTNFQLSLGSWISDAPGNCFMRLLVSGNSFKNWGQSVTPGPYYMGLDLGRGNASKRYLISGNMFEITGTKPGTTYVGMFLGHANGQINVTGNTCVQTEYCIWSGATEASTNPILVSGNTSTLTGTAAVRQTGAHAMKLVGNFWDVPPSPVLTSGWGAGATKAAGSEDFSGKVTVGTTPASPGVLTFALAKPAAMSCWATNETTGVVLPAVASTTALSITGTKVAGDVVSYGCLSR